MKRLTLVFAIALVLAALLWLVGDWARTSPPNDSTTTSTFDAAAVGEPAAPLGATERDESTLDRPAIADGESTRRTTELANVPAPESFELRLVAHATGAPVPEAEVLHAAAPASMHSTWSHAHRDIGALITLAETTGISSRADAEGRALVPWPDGRVVVLARGASSRGMALLDSTSTPPVVIEMHPDTSITVQVVDLAGAPRAGVPVALRAHGGARFDDVLVATTDTEAGTVSLRHVALAVARNDADRWSVAIAAVLAPAVERELSVDALPSSPITLVLPPTGEAEVWLLRADGSVSTDDTEVGLRCVATANDDTTNSRPLREFDVRVRTSSGRAVFPHVVVGSMLEAGALQPRFATERRVRARGPASAGERATLILTVDDPSEPQPRAR